MLVNGAHRGRLAPLISVLLITTTDLTHYCWGGNRLAPHTERQQAAINGYFGQINGK
jgi:hypothetical protein